MNLFKPVAVHPIIPKDGGDANSSAQHDISEPSISESNEESTTMSSPGQALPITSQSKNQSKPTTNSSASRISSTNELLQRSLSLNMVETNAPKGQ